jgi:2-keto-4-pentenoate hydratase/2-oxohepta-3-ene-1,7-dioic acid hydratase in catechol pathway
VIVISKRAKNVPTEQANDYILGYTCGNDVSERNWQNGSIDGPEHKDLQWWRAKGSETFGPVGPCVAAGLDYEKSKIQLRLNGQVKQDAMLSDLIHKPPETVSFISRYVTLEPGDMIFTGTSGTTSRMNPGDVVEVEIDGIGILRNRIAA